MGLEEDQIEQLRKNIDETDREIVRLIMERSRFVVEIGEKKRQGATTVYRPDREKEVYNKVVAVAHELYGDRLPLPEQSIRSIYREIMSGSIAIEGGPGVAYLGPPASFSHLAARHRFGSSIRTVPSDTIPEIFRAVESGRDVSYGIVPVENSTGGSVLLTLDTFLVSDLKIYAEHYERIRQNLIGPAGLRISEIKKLYTIKIAREQCRNWMQKNLHVSELEVIETSSTAQAAAMVAERKDGVAIASELAAETYGLEVIASGIQDNSNNLTRFLVIGRENCAPSGDDKTSIVCSVHDQPGSLFDILKPFYDNKVNMTRIESRTSRRQYGDYNFFIDFLGHYQDAMVVDILEKLKEKTTQLKLLGSYPRIDLPVG